MTLNRHFGGIIAANRDGRYESFVAALGSYVCRSDHAAPSFWRGGGGGLLQGGGKQLPAAADKPSPFSRRAALSCAA